MSLDPDLLPGHPHPHSDELLSSWIRRLARANKTDYRFFVSRHVSRNAQVDVDRKLTEEMAEKLEKKTVATKEEIISLSLRKYAPPLLTPEEMKSKRPPWVTRYGFNLEKQAALSDYYPDTKPTNRTFYYPYCPDCYKEEASGPYVKRVWRLAFVTVCPAHHRALLDYDQPEERPPKEVASRALERLSTLQQVLFEALRNGKAPSAIISSKGKRLSGSELFAGFHLLMRTVAAPKAGRFLRLALTSGSPGFNPSLPKEGIHTVEHASIASRRQVMLFLAALLSDWPKPLEEGLAAAGLTYERLLSNSEPSDRTRWLEGYASEVDGSDIPAPPEPIEVGKRTNRIEKLTLEEVFELQPIAREQFELLGITEKDLSAATLSNEEWKTVQSVFSDRGDYPCLLHNRAVLSLMRLMRDKDLEPEDLPEALFRPVERATDKRESKRAELLAEALKRL